MKQDLLNVLTGKKSSLLPWVPFSGVHSGSLKGYTAADILTDADKLFESLMEVNKLYRPDGQPVVFDLQIEAEILGCELLWAKKAPPSVASHPLDTNKIIPRVCTLPSPEDGRLPIILNVMRRMKEAVGGTTALFGLICGPFTLASHLRGNDIFMDMYDDEQYVFNLIKYCAKAAKRMAHYYIDAGMDVIAVVDPLVSQISSDHFERFLSEAFLDIFRHIKALGAVTSFFVCGDATRNIESMCKTSPDSIFVDENVDIAAAKRITDSYGITIGGNIPLTSVMLHGTQQDNMKYVIDLIDSFKNKDRLVIAPGCDMPYDVPVDNVIAITQAVTKTAEARKILENYTAADEDIAVNIPDYAGLKKPLIEVFTLDSDTCAACTYMMGAANAIKQEYGEKIEVIEYKFTEKQNIARCKKMGVSHLPSIYINGRLKFSSIIPSKEDFSAAVVSQENFK